MRKAFIILLATIILLCNYSAIAEEQFSIRNNVQFGDSVETVKEKDEIMKNKEASEFNVAGYIYYPAHLVEHNTELAGLESSLYYCFDDTGLKEIVYVILKDKYSLKNVTPDQFKAVYAVLKESLTEKYGQPLDKNDIRATVLLGNYMERNAHPTEKGTYAATGMSFSYREVGFDSWLLEYDDYFVKIDLNYIDNSNKDRYHIILGYCKFSKDEYETILADYGDLVTQYLKDIDNSI